ncbi:MAG: peptidoglycan editing factor PgeF [Rhodocyclaceae bacterium]|nr:peptidoglycan editing factor PgeF [Rhodocyclaceae bacterium]MDZ4213665.1 peptidoglycan editing factor PgeF [Rhodocyclaceae bacterium]
MKPEFIIPDWPAPSNVQAIQTTRSGGVSIAPYASLNLGDHVGDAPAAVAENRRLLRTHLPDEPVWLKQVHGTHCLDAATAVAGTEADAAFTRQPGVVCAVLTADCLPVLLCDDAGTVVAAAHAGWRGLAAGVIETTVAAMNLPGAQLMAWLGPAIGAENFEVGGEVREAFVTHNRAAAAAFAARPHGKWRCDLYALARFRLEAMGISRITGADFCTAGDADRFFSYRRDGTTGRMASLIWRQ